MRRSVNEYDENRGGSSKLFKALENNAGPAALAGAGAAGYADYKQTKQREQDKSEAASEMKRESRGVQKPANFDAIEEAKQDAKDRAAAKKQEKAYNKSLTTENKAKGGYVKAADGCCSKGKTRGKMV